MHLTKRFNLRPDERVVAVIRRSVLAYAGPVVLALFSLFLAFFLIVPLFARGRFGTALFVLLIVLGVYLVFRTLWFWYWTAFIVTNSRIIDTDQRGVFHRRISEARFEKVEDIAIEIRGIVATLFHLGTVRIQTTSGHATIELRTVPRPELVHELLSRLRGQAKNLQETSRFPAVHPSLDQGRSSPPRPGSGPEPGASRRYGVDSTLPPVDSSSGSLTDRDRSIPDLSKLSQPELIRLREQVEGEVRRRSSVSPP